MMEWLGLKERGGALRLGLARYNTADEVNRVVEMTGATIPR